MKYLMSALALSFAALSGSAFATSHKEAPMMKSDATCETKATDKKLAGAAKTSFMKKCDKDSAAMMAKTTCDTQAADKKLAGAAKNSFTKKCVADAAKPM